MSRIWAWADTHFGHRNILTFRDYNGELIRGKVFKDIEHHDNTMVDNANHLVAPSDHLYFLGDVSINKKGLECIRRINGHKRLVMGNHDIFHVKDYLNAGFDKCMAYRVWPKHGIIFSHIPVHPESLMARGWKNTHGHLHSGQVLKSGIPDPSYQCVSVEHTDYSPILIFENGNEV